MFLWPVLEWISLRQWHVFISGGSWRSLFLWSLMTGWPWFYLDSRVKYCSKSKSFQIKYSHNDPTEKTAETRPEDDSLQYSAWLADLFFKVHSKSAIMKVQRGTWALKAFSVSVILINPDLSQPAACLWLFMMDKGFQCCLDVACFAVFLDQSKLAACSCKCKTFAYSKFLSNAAAHVVMDRNVA